MHDKNTHYTMRNTSQRRHNHQNRGPRNHTRDQNQVQESVGPQGKIRGSLSQIIEKYVSLGKDSLSQRDFIEAENFFQHAEHYRRLLNQNKPQQTNVPSHAKTQDGLQETPNKEKDPNPDQHNKADRKAKKTSPSESNQTEALPSFLTEHEEKPAPSLTHTSDSESLLLKKTEEASEEKPKRKRVVRARKTNIPEEKPKKSTVVNTKDKNNTKDE